MTPTTEQLDILTEKTEKKLNNELISMYKKSLDETRLLITKNFEKYSEEGILNYATMQKYNRLAGLEASILQEIQSLYKNAGLTLTNNLKKMYVENYFYTGFIFESITQVKLGLTLLSPEVIKKAIQNPISGLTLNQRLQKNRTNVIIKTREQLTQGLIQGESIQQMTKRIKDIYDGDVKKSIRIAQTETNRVRNAGKEKGYEKAKDKGIEFKKVWVSTLDSHTRNTHKKLDGMYANKKGYFVIAGKKALYPGGFGVAEFDINCRCTSRAEFKDLKPTVRKDNEKKENIPYVKYEEWFNERVSK